MPASNAPFVWYELMTSDLKAAETFYTQVLHWTPRDPGMPGRYTLMSVGDADVAAVMATPPALAAIGSPTGWSGYIAVDDVDAMAARVLRAGGKQLSPALDIPGIGRFAPVADPQGAIFSLFKALPLERPAQPPLDTPGTIGWHELYVPDTAAAFDFYSSLFGWTRGASHDMGPLGVYQVFEIDGVQGGGIMTSPPEMRGAGWGYYFNIEAIGAAVARVLDAGGQVRNGPMQVPGGHWMVQALDPQGAAFSLVSAQA